MLAQRQGGGAVRVRKKGGGVGQVEKGACHGRDFRRDARKVDVAKPVRRIRPKNIILPKNTMFDQGDPPLTR